MFITVGNFKEIEIGEKHIAVLEIHSKGLFRSVLDSFQKYLNHFEGNERIIFHSKQKEVDLSRKILCCNLNEIDFKATLMQKKLIGLVSKDIRADIELSVKLESLYIEILENLDNIFLEIDLDIEYQEDFNIENFLKLLCFNLKGDDKCLLDQLFFLIDIIAEFNLYECVIFNGLKNYFEDVELVEVYKYFGYKKVNVLLLESTPHDIVIKGEYKLVVDRDFDDYFVKSLEDE